ncbi:THC0290_0291 family protein [Winogradskyella sp. UBA3174]|uniref:THC0290_0291 family protein n=1 Tax=Winogradskyella sp. UBA3174 TaxID=1947785 RepID=UPI002600B90C|nr:glutamate dehydrogenase [Winogradskyella sp. UBA3174]|tara:strand:- start:39939 stop:40742 length:804 start_codon:yes stop_codon:yes gene_type:complete
MIKYFKGLFLFLLVICSVQNSYSQLGFSHEIGAFVGSVAFKSDFGVRNNFSTNAGNTGIAVGIVHYINFAYRADCNCYSTDTYFNDHFKLRSEISWNKTELEHIGKWVDNSRTSEEANQLRAHTGEAQNWDVGMQLEYFPMSIRAFSAGVYSFAPFIAAGAHFVSYNPSVNTTFGNGNINNNDNFYNFWGDAANGDPFIDAEGGNTWSVVASVGTRYKLSVLSDLFIELRGQYYFNDFIDGLDHNLPSNKNNDWNVWLNFGYIYYLD